MSAKLRVHGWVRMRVRMRLRIRVRVWVGGSVSRRVPVRVRVRVSYGHSKCLATSMLLLNCSLGNPCSWDHNPQAKP